MRNKLIAIDLESKILELGMKKIQNKQTTEKIAKKDNRMENALEKINELIFNVLPEQIKTSDNPKFQRYEKQYHAEQAHQTTQTIIHYLVAILEHNEEALKAILQSILEHVESYVAKPEFIKGANMIFAKFIARLENQPEHKDLAFQLSEKFAQKNLFDLFLAIENNNPKHYKAHLEHFFLKGHDDFLTKIIIKVATNKPFSEKNRVVKEYFRDLVLFYFSIPTSSARDRLKNVIAETIFLLSEQNNQKEFGRFFNIISEIAKKYPAINKEQLFQLILDKMQ